VPATGPLVERAEALGASVAVLPDFALRKRNVGPWSVVRWVGRYIAAAAALCRLHRRDRFDLIYANSLAAALGPPLRLLWRRPLVQHVREYPHHAHLVRRVVLSATAATAETVVCNSEYTRDLVVAAEPRLTARSVTIHNGLDLGRSTVPTTISGDRLRVVCVARIHPKKGQEYLLDAARTAMADGSDWEIHFFGGCLPEHVALHDELVATATLPALAGRVIFHGFVADTVVLYDTADVVVVPSVVPEEFSLVCVEAQSLGLPVVATGPGGPSEVLIDGVTGLIVPPRDARALANAIRRLEHDPTARREMGRAGQKRMTECFGRQRYAGEIASLLAEALARRPPSRGAAAR
jgi:glycosyltransferase involved in cell wall biosynthesis